MEHSTLGTITFTLIKDENRLWKVCNIAIFGETEDPSKLSTCPSHETFSKEILEYLNIENLDGRKPLFDHPYQYIFCPFALKTTDDISTYLKLCRGKDSQGSVSFTEHQSKVSQPRTLLASRSTSLREINVCMYTEAGNVSNVLDLLVFSRHLSNEGGIRNVKNEDNSSACGTISCVIVASEQTRPLERDDVEE